eukprot:TRINITY_DN48607_c1_g2_i1.p1 TRINITY_DN48607_c1_g2~~TRINITY_DN48607_c1_g2_i1.p1  ORF type:complete len:448 (-),score=128.33 TRINITY_DN48607_c1_g2_i1:124-1467(-)
MFIINFVFLFSGDYELSVLFNDCHISDSPFTVNVKPALTHAGKCLVEGEGVKIASPDVTNQFRIIAVDNYDERRADGGDEFVVHFDGPAQLLEVIDNSDGSYTVNYELTKNLMELLESSDPHIEIHVSHSHESYQYARPIKGSPFHPSLDLSRRALPAPPMEAEAEPEIGSQQPRDEVLSNVALPSTKESIPAPPLIQQDPILNTPAPARNVATSHDIFSPTHPMTPLHVDSQPLTASALRTEEPHQMNNKPPVSAISRQMDNLHLREQQIDQRYSQLQEMQRSLADGRKKRSVPTPLKTPSSRTPVSAPAPKDPVSELKSVQVINLFNKYKTNLQNLLTAYGVSGGMPVDKFVQMTKDFDICPTFLSTKEVRTVFSQCCSEASCEQIADYDLFIECLGHVAISALSRPAFRHLYPTVQLKVVVLLDMWGFGSSKQFAKIQERKRSH